MPNLVAVLGDNTQTSDLVTSFIAAMIMYPNVQRRAQAEIDKVVGRDRLPRISDRDNLPYLAAVQKETLRWNPVAAQGESCGLL